MLLKSLSENDTLLDCVLSLFPIAKGSEKKFIYEDAKASDPLLLRQFFINFWTTRNPTNPEGEWLGYQREVVKVNAEYGTKHLKGYQTDRGRVFLQYGPPDNLIRSENEPNIYPYEIWQYYKINEQSNKRFIFYVNELSGNNYKLLHSDVSGEIYNANWQYELQNNKSANDPNSINNGAIHIQQNYNDLK